MQERPQNFSEVDEEPEATLVTPRFDAEEARRAEPVVPLSETHARPRRGPRRSWATALLAVVLLAAVAAGGVLASKVLRRPQTNAPAQTEAAPAPPQTADAPQPQETTPAPQEAPPAAPQMPREEASAKRPPRAPRDSREREAGERVLPAPAQIPRGAVEDSGDRDDERRGHAREKRRGREDDDAEKETRKAPKHAKSKVPRLVDVLTGP
jgi:type IV secretory pathway VirB10-like protein